MDGGALEERREKGLPFGSVLVVLRIVDADEPAQEEGGGRRRRRRRR